MKNDNRIIEEQKISLLSIIQEQKVSFFLYLVTSLYSTLPKINNLKPALKNCCCPHRDIPSY